MFADDGKSLTTESARALPSHRSSNILSKTRRSLRGTSDIITAAQSTQRSELTSYRLSPDRRAVVYGGRPVQRTAEASVPVRQRPRGPSTQ